jgi:hypothetical protein
VENGAFSCADPRTFAERFSAMFDGLSVQVATGQPRRTRATALRTCIEFAELELASDR